MTLYEINSQINNLMDIIFDSVDEETGEVDPELMEQLSTLNLERDQKLDNIGAYIKNLDAEAKAIKDEIDALKKRLDSKKNKIESLKEYVANDLQYHGDTKKESARVVFSFRKSKAVEITDESLIPKDYIVTKTETRVDKIAIKHAIDECCEVPGAVLVDRVSLQIK